MKNYPGCITPKKAAAIMGLGKNGMGIAIRDKRIPVIKANVNAVAVRISDVKDYMRKQGWTDEEIQARFLAAELLTESK